MRVVWSGTTSRPTTITNRTFRPGKFIQAKAYAAKAATKTGMIVAGIVMNRLLMNASIDAALAEDVLRSSSSVRLPGGKSAGPPAGVGDVRRRAGTS